MGYRPEPKSRLTRLYISENLARSGQIARVEVSSSVVHKPIIDKCVRIEARVVATMLVEAFWYIDIPQDELELRAMLERALGKARDARQLAVLQRQLRETGRLGDLVGASKQMQEVMRIVET